MSLELPTAAELIALEDNELGEDDAIQLAADLFTMATGITDTPSDNLQQRLIHNAILQMAWALRTQHEDMEEMFSPFLSERLGSYSYSKTYSRVSSAVEESRKTGIPLFDQAVSYFNRMKLKQTDLFSSEQVFVPGERWASDDLYTPYHEDPFYLIKEWDL